MKSVLMCRNETHQRALEEMLANLMLEAFANDEEAMFFVSRVQLID